MFEMNAYLGHHNLPAFWRKNFYGPLFIGVAFFGMGIYIRIFDENEERIGSFGYACLILGSCSVFLSVCWFMFEYKDRRQTLSRTRLRSNLINREVFLSLGNISNHNDNAIYLNYLNGRHNSRCYDQQLDQPPPTYQQAIRANKPSFINLEHDYSNAMINSNAFIQRNTTDLMNNLNKSHDKTNQINSKDFCELSIASLECLALPSYEDAVKKMDELTETTTKL